MDGIDLLLGGAAWWSPFPLLWQPLSHCTEDGWRPDGTDLVSRGA
jgi:hypothetical protein